MSEILKESDERTERMIREGCLMDDYVMSAALDGRTKEVGYILYILTGVPGLTVEQVTTQKWLENVLGRSVKLDVYAVDENGKRYNIEIQNDDEGAIPKRARYHSALMDTHLLEKGQPFSELPETYIIFLTKNDYFRGGVPLYFIDRTVWTDLPLLNESKKWRIPRALFGDSQHIIYVNGAYEDDTTEIGRLIHDFKCVDPKEMLTPLKDHMSYLKFEREGRMVMSDKFRSYFKEELEAEIAESRAEADTANLKIVEMLRAGKTNEEILTEIDCAEEQINAYRKILEC